MKNHIFRIALIFAIVVGVTFYMLNYVFFNPLTSQKSKAAGDTMTLSFNPATASLTSDGQAATTTIKVKPSVAMYIRGYQFKVTFDNKYVEIRSLTNLITGISSLGLDETIADMNKNGYIIVRGQSTVNVGKALSTNAVDIISISFARKAEGGSNIAIDKDDVSFYKINSSTGALTAIKGDENKVLEINGGGPTDTPAPTGEPSPTVVGGVDATLKLKLKFQGINHKPSDELNKLKVKFKLYNEVIDKYTDSDADNFTADDNGVWSGDVVFNGVVPGVPYVLLVKGPYHIQKKVCVKTPTETAAGTYRCIKGQISLVAGDNSLDLSGITLMSGDLPVQDGSVTAYDTSLIRNNLGKTDADALALADVNRDGIVNTQDYSLVIASLSVKNDEQ